MIVSSSSPFGGVARSHARAARERGVSARGGKERRCLLFLLPSRSRLLLQLASFATRNGEFKLKQEDLSKQG